ncbi:hypothetical protein [Streptomyces silvensis]|uniref:Uncharacterized protein n=1 Tax=Streptomyces silvensis TaxID=1765722 RepID=A0A0W7X6K6_9ACTN|nr:hypothetical protein [Streptomyces silvensis]KUF18432.1 hypothetical protein AT728_18975 [Streptomyces silvensis]
MPQMIISTSAGPITVDAAEPVPGLHVYEIPAHVSPMSSYRWILAHHEGAAMASFATESAATAAAVVIAPLADWTRNAMTTANQIGPGGTKGFVALLRNTGGQHPNA